MVEGSEKPTLNGLEIRPSRQVFVNRNLRLGKIGMIGFDMDYTLAQYRKKPMEKLAFKKTLEKLIARGYPERIAEFQYDPGFAVRGTAIDRRLGNIIKIDSFHQIQRAYHGVRLLPKDERDAIYRTKFDTERIADFAWIDTLFGLPEVYLFAKIVEVMEEELEHKVDYIKLQQDIRETIDEAHRDGSIKGVIAQDWSKYLLQDKELAYTLHRFRSAGKKLFLLTNSEFSYTKGVMGYILSGVLPEYPQWTNYFDIIVCKASKPLFFTGATPFLALDAEGNPTGEEHNALKRGVCYEGGNLAELEKLSGMKGDQVLYVGDHIYGDVLRLKKDSLWRTAMILPELEEEIETLAKLRTKLDRADKLEQSIARADYDIYTLSQLIQLQTQAEAGTAVPAAAAPGAGEPRPEAGELRRNLSQRMDKELARLKKLTSEQEALWAEIEQHFNPYWGPLFKSLNENSRFGEQVRDYACLYTSRVSNFLYYSTNRYFLAPRNPLPHEKHIAAMEFED